MEGGKKPKKKAARIVEDFNPAVRPSTDQNLPPFNEIRGNRFSSDPSSPLPTFPSAAADSEDLVEESDPSQEIETSRNRTDSQTSGPKEKSGSFSGPSGNPSLLAPPVSSPSPLSLSSSSSLTSLPFSSTASIASTQGIPAAQAPVGSSANSLPFSSTASIASAQGIPAAQAPSTAFGAEDILSSAAHLTNQLTSQIAAQLPNISLGAADQSKVSAMQHSKERENLLNIFKLVVKTLLSYGMDLGEPIDDDKEPLVHFFIVMEHVFQHGLKMKRTIFGRKKESWEFIENLEKLHPPAQQLVLTVRSLSGITTSLGRGRAFVRSSLMEKTLSENWRILVEENPTLLADWYEPWSLLRSDDVATVTGMLLGLNSLDFNLCLRGEDLERQSTALDWSLFLKDGNYIGSRGKVQEEEPKEEDIQAAQQRKLAAAMDQRVYVEELNKKLEKKLQEANEKVEQLTLANQKLQKIGGTGNFVQATDERILALKNEIVDLKDAHRKELESVKMGVTDMTMAEMKGEASVVYEGLKNTLEAERKLRLQLEKDLNAERIMKGSDILELKKQVTVLEVDLKSLKEKKQQAMEESEKMGRLCVELKKDNDDLKFQLEDSRNVTKNMNEAVKEGKTKAAALVKAKKDLKALQDNLDTLTPELEATKAQLAKALKEKDEAESRLTVCEKQMSELQRTLTSELEEGGRKDVELNSLRSDLSLLKEEKVHLQQMIRDQEKSLWEMADKAEQQQIRLNDLSEINDSMKSEAWTNDQDIHNCMNCNDAFSLSKRKHHCRSCGKVFCANCSDNKMMLPSSKKPVRVCDGCYPRLLQKHSAT